MNQLEPILSSKQIFAWYWGHEHRLVVHERHEDWGMFGRCVGHGGMPYFRDKFRGVAPERTAMYEKRGFIAEDISVPTGMVLDGPNPYLGDKRTKYGPNGYLVLEIEGAEIAESYRLPNGEEIFRTHLV